MFLTLFFYSLIGFKLGWFFSVIWVKLTVPIKKVSVVGGFHLHHSIWGLVAILISLFFIHRVTLFIFLLNIGAGIILEHGIKHDGFVFITKER